MEVNSEDKVTFRHFFSLMFWTENNSQILLFEAGVLTMAIPASPDTHATSEIECLKKKPSQEYIP